jgi:hypothetical protein
MRQKRVLVGNFGDGEINVFDPTNGRTHHGCKITTAKHLRWGPEISNAAGTPSRIGPPSTAFSEGAGSSLPVPFFCASHDRHRIAFVLRSAPRLIISLRYRMGGRAVEGTGLENRQARKGLVGSNPTPSAK